MNLLFDMDGTLVDSSPGILAALHYAQEQLDLQKLPESEELKFIGPPLAESFRLAYAMNVTEAEAAVRSFRTYYAQQGLLQAELYPGVQEGLLRLTWTGHRCYVATSKPTAFAESIASRLGISRYFRAIVGSDEAHPNKQTVIREVLRSQGLKEEECLMVGDTCNDILAAEACRIDAVGVRYGFGTEEELKGAILIVDKFQDLCECFVEDY